MNHQKTTLCTLEQWERIAFDYENSFLKSFCHDAWQLVGVYWCSEKMKVVYVLSSGKHITDSIDMDKWLEFYHSKIESDAAKALRRVFEDK